MSGSITLITRWHDIEVNHINLSAKWYGPGDVQVGIGSMFGEVWLNADKLPDLIFALQTLESKIAEWKQDE